MLRTYNVTTKVHRSRTTGEICDARDADAYEIVESHEVDVEVDFDGIARRIGARAIRNVGGRATQAGGLVRCRRIRKL